MIASEVQTWPNVSTRRMFGMTALYTGQRIFAAVADKRALGTDRSIIFKLEQPSSAARKRLASDPRIRKSDAVGQKWYGFELSSPDDIRDALAWFDVAYRAARKAS